MKKLFTIKSTTNAKKKRKYPYKIHFSDGRVVPEPYQHNFASSFIRNHGCSLVAFYMALRYLKLKKSMNWCYKYMQKNYSLNGHAKYSLEQIAKAINKISESKTASFYEQPSSLKIQKALKHGDMVLFEEKNPIHSVVLLWNGNVIKRFSDGKSKNITVNQEVKRRCGDSYYGGCVIVKKL